MPEDRGGPRGRTESGMAMEISKREPREPGVQYQFGDFRLDSRTLELYRGDGRVPLEPLPARILCRLVERSGDLVTRRELRELGWPRLPGAADPSLNTCIRQIREALGDDASAPAFIETLRGRGYRLRAPVRAGHPARRYTARSRGWRRWRWVVVGSAAALVSIPAGLLDPDRAGHDPSPPAAGRGQGASDDPGLRLGLAKARYLVERSRDVPGALALLEALAGTYPAAAEVHAERAEALALLDRREEAWEAVATALAVDEGAAGAHRALGLLRMTAGDWTGAEAALRRATALAPDTPRNLNALAFLHTATGRFEEAGGLLERVAELDPLNPLLRGDAGLMHLWAGRYRAAVDACTATLELLPEAVWAVGCVFDAWVLAGRPEEAVPWGLRILDHLGMAPGELQEPPPEDVLAAVRRARTRAWAAAVERGRASPYGLALAYAAEGRIEEGLQALTAAVDARSVSALTLAVDPRLATLRRTSAFRELVAEMGLEGSG